MTDIDHNRSDKEVLIFKKMPYTQWGIGLLVFTFGTIFLFYLAEGHTRKEGFMGMQYKETRNQDIKWYHFLTSILIIFLGLLFIFFSKIRIVEFDKFEGVVRKITKSLLFLCQPN